MTKKKKKKNLVATTGRKEVNILQSNREVMFKSGLSKFGLPLIDDSLIQWNFDKMREVCLSPEEFFQNLPADYNLPVPTVGYSSTGPYLFFDRGGSTLGVAHLDSVANYKHFNVVDYANGKKVFCSTLDDRLGAYIVLSLLVDYGVDHDILLTTNEETMQSTAEGFTSEKQYNWIFQFDRSGTDCVMYEYEDDLTQELILKYGWDVGLGSYTDICELEGLNCKGFNFGTGYYEYHTKNAFAELPATGASVALFLEFHKEMKETYLYHKEDPDSKWWRYNSWGHGYSRYNRGYDKWNWSTPETRPLGGGSAPRVSVFGGDYEAADDLDLDELDGMSIKGACKVCGRIRNIYLTGGIYLCEECIGVPDDEDEAPFETFSDMFEDETVIPKHTGFCVYCDLETDNILDIGFDKYWLCPDCEELFKSEAGNQF